jgi:hypothetical protein
LSFRSARITILPVQPKPKPESLDDLLTNAEHSAAFSPLISSVLLIHSEFVRAVFRRYDHRGRIADDPKEHVK